MESSQQLVESLKTYMKSEASDCLWKWETKTIFNKVNEPENLRQPIANAHIGLHHLACIKIERLDNIQINESNNYLQGENK